jgi:hypothetical protein
MTLFSTDSYKFLECKTVNVIQLGNINGECPDSQEEKN